METTITLMESNTITKETNGMSIEVKDLKQGQNLKVNKHAILTLQIEPADCFPILDGDFLTYKILQN